MIRDRKTIYAGYNSERQGRGFADPNSGRR